MLLTLKQYNTPDQFGGFIAKRKAEKHTKTIELFSDIETFAYNKNEPNPKDRKNETYSVAVAWWVIGETYPRWTAFPHFSSLVDCIAENMRNKRTGKVPKSAPTVKLYFHNGDKYDHHYLHAELLRDYPETVVHNLWQRTIRKDLQPRHEKPSSASVAERQQGAMYESRVRSSTHVSLQFYNQGVFYVTEDTLPKTTLALKELGEKLLRLSLIPEEFTKQDETFNYAKYDKQHDMPENEAKLYAGRVFEQLNEEELQYIGNDVILLAMTARHYDKMYQGKRFEDRTLNIGIKRAYTEHSSLATFQMLNGLIELNEKGKPTFSQQAKLQQFGLFNYKDNVWENFYKVLRGYYRGGMNLYNDCYVGKIIQEDCFSIDINSSYPYTMYAFKFPTYLIEANTYKQPTLAFLDLENDNRFYLYRLSINDFNRLFIRKMRSRVMRQIFVKRFINENGFVNVSSIDIANMNRFLNEPVTNIPVWLELVYATRYFGSRDTIANYYAIKTQGKNRHKLDCSNPLDIKPLDELIPENELLSEAEIYNAKKDMNAGYGLTALRPAFPIALVNPDGTMENIPNGVINRERNVLFAVTITMRALENLLMPLSYLTPQEIDECFLYCDTDSLYLKKKIIDRLPETIFHSMNLGAWDIENHHISKFFVLHHKKYCYFSEDMKKGKKKGLQIHAGGVPLKSFKTDGVDFETFVNTQFSQGKSVKTKKNTYTKQGKIHIYDGTVDLEQGGTYPIEMSEQSAKERQKWLEQLRIEEDELNADDKGDTTLYYESEQFGTASIADLNPFPYPNTHLAPITQLIERDKMIRNKLE